MITLFFLDCFSTDQVRALIARLQSSLQPGYLWFYADFALPPAGWPRLRARAWLSLMFTFFRWQTGLRTRSLPDAETALLATGLTRLAHETSQNGFLVSSVFIPSHLSLNK